MIYFILPTGIVKTCRWLEGGGRQYPHPRESSSTGPTSQALGNSQGKNHWRVIQDEPSMRSHLSSTAATCTHCCLYLPWRNPGTCQTERKKNLSTKKSSSRQFG